jgi:sulfide:quinone oxidoreductase
MGRTALVLGAGVGGLAAAQALRRALPRDDRVVLVDRSDRHVFQSSLPWVLVGGRTVGQISRPLASAARQGIELISGEITRISPDQRTAEVGGQTLRGDAMLIALGAEYNEAAVPGLAAAGHCLYSPQGVISGQRALESFEAGRIVFLTAAAQYKCPAAPYEFALLADHALRRRGVRAKVQVDFYAAEPGPMMVAGAEVSAAVRQLLESREITYHPARQVTAVDAVARRLKFADGQEVPYDLLLYVPPHRAPAVIRDAGLTNESGWIPVDRHTLATRFDGVYAIGDVTVIPLKMGRPLPKAGVFAHGQAEVVANNIAAGWAGRSAPARFEGGGACFIEIGGGRAGMGHGNFYAEPLPAVRLRTPSVLWHGAKVLYEKYWLYSTF